MRRLYQKLGDTMLRLVFLGKEQLLTLWFNNFDFIWRIWTPSELDETIFDLFLFKDFHFSEAQLFFMGEQERIPTSASAICNITA